MSMTEINMLINKFIGMCSSGDNLIIFIYSYESFFI